VLQGEREMAYDNRTLARFQLTGMPAAPRGLPQIEVTFDIDANGIVHVSAKDLATGKEQSIKITASSGLSEGDIQKMVKDAERFSEEDKKKREQITLKNNLDNLCYSTEKLLKENGDKISADTKSELESAVKEAREVVQKENWDAMQQHYDKLNSLSHKMAEEMYKASAQGGGGTGGPSGSDPGAQQGGAKSEDEPIEAEFREEKGN